MRARSLPFLFLIPLFLFAGPAARAADWLYLTVAGDTLIGIGQKYLKNPNDWPKVRVVNQVGDPKKLPTGSHLRIPVELLKVTPAPVEVTAASGNVRYRRADGPFQALAAGTRLHGGETVLTGPRSSAAFRFADGTVLTQQASSRIGFGRLAAWGATGMVATEINLEAGRLEASAARQQAPAGGFKVVTPVAVAGLRGTGFRLNLDEDGKTLRGEVTEGAVAIAAQGEEVRVEGGYGTITELGKPPRAPRPLLARPDLSGLPDARTTDALAFTWPTPDSTTSCSTACSPLRKRAGRNRRRRCPAATTCARAPSTPTAWKASAPITPSFWRWRRRPRRSRRHPSRNRHRSRPRRRRPKWSRTAAS